MIGAAIEVHRELGPGLLESAYELALEREFARCRYSDKGRSAGIQRHRAWRRISPDLLVDDALVVEVKAVDRLQPIHDAQLLTAFEACANKRLGLINFNERTLKEGRKAGRERFAEEVFRVLCVSVPSASREGETMLLMIDNYDPFTYNIVQYSANSGQDVQVYRNDAISLAGDRPPQTEILVISPGPNCAPAQAGISLAAIREFAGKIRCSASASPPVDRRGLRRAHRACHS